MTTTLVLPGTFKIEGVFLFGQSDLLEIDQLMKGAKKEIDATVRRQLLAEVKNEMQKFDKDATDAPSEEVVRKIISSSYPYKKHEHKVEVVCKSNRIFKARSFKEIADDLQIANELPTQAVCTYSNAGFRLKVELFTGYSQGISIAVSPPDTALTMRLLQQISSWVESKRKVELWRRIAMPLTVTGFSSSVWLAIMAPLGVRRTVSERPSVVEQARKLLEDGIDDTMSAKAIELLLRLETRHYAEHEEIYFAWWWLAGLAVCIGTVLATLLRPKSTLGLGRSAKRLKFYQNIAKVSNFALGFWGGAVLGSLLANFIYDRFK